MIPILFAEDATTFTTNGLGRLDALSCVVTEERNGIYELEMTILETALHADEIVMSSIIVAKPNQTSDNQAFRVYKISKPINGKFTVYAQHISYQLIHIPTMPFTVTASSTACTETLAGLVSNAVEDCPFSFSTDVTTSASYEQTVPASIRSRLGGVDGSVLDQFGGEYEWDNYSVILHEARGVTTPTVSLRYGKNITDLKQEENIENTITGIVPFWASSEGDTVVTLSEEVIESSYADNYPYKRTVAYDFSASFEEEPTESELRTKAQSYVNASGLGVPKVSISLSFVNLADTEGYADVADLQTLSLCDYVYVYFEKLDISTTAEIVKTEYDVLKEKYESLEIGSLRSTLVTTITDNNNAISTLANNTRRLFKSYNNTVETLVDNATAWLTGSSGYVMAVKNDDGTWKELLFMDTADADTAINVLRINENGIGFSSTGVDGPYTQAWTLDGKLVIGGTNVPSLTVYDSDSNVIFQTSADGTIWNSTNSSMDEDGNLTVNEGTITAGTISGSTITGATIQTASEGARILMNDTSSVMGYYDDTMHNLINMEQSVSGTHQMTIDADTQLNIRTPDLYVINDSAGTGTLTAYQTATGEYAVVSGVTKNLTAEDCRELWVAGVSEDEGEVYCTLPVYLNVTTTSYNRYLGMTVTGETSETVVI